MESKHAVLGRRGKGAGEESSLLLKTKPTDQQVQRLGGGRLPHSLESPFQTLYPGARGSAQQAP